MSRRQTGHWMITSTTEGDDIHWVQQAATTPPAEAFVGFSQRVEFVHVDWETIGERIRPLFVEGKSQKVVTNHFTAEEDLFEL